MSYVFFQQLQFIQVSGVESIRIFSLLLLLFQSCSLNKKHKRLISLRCAFKSELARQKFKVYLFKELTARQLYFRALCCKLFESCFHLVLRCTLIGIRSSVLVTLNESKRKKKSKQSIEEKCYLIIRVWSWAESNSRESRGSILPHFIWVLLSDRKSGTSFFFLLNILPEIQKIQMNEYAQP